MRHPVYPFRAILRELRQDAGLTILAAAESTEYGNYERWESMVSRGLVLVSVASADLEHGRERDSGCGAERHQPEEVRLVERRFTPDRVPDVRPRRPVGLPRTEGDDTGDKRRAGGERRPSSPTPGAGAQAA